MIAAKSPIRILHLEDSPSDAELIKNKLDGGGLNCDLMWADSREQFETAMTSHAFDVILCDYDLPLNNGLSALGMAHKQQPGVPVLIISGSLNEEDVVKCLKLGATDYLLKERLERLVPAVERALEESTEHRKHLEAETKLNNSDDHFRQLAEQSTVGFYFAALHPQRFLYVSPAVENVWGIPASVFYQNDREWFESVHPNDRDRIQQLWDDCSNGVTALYDAEYTIIRPDGTMRLLLVNGTPNRDKHGHIVRIGGVIQDITERKNAEVALLESEERFRQLAEQSPDGFWFTEVNPEKIVYVSPSIERIWGMPAERFYQDFQTWMRVTHPDDMNYVLEWWTAFQIGKNPKYELEYRIIRDDGELRWVLVTGAPNYDASGKVFRIGGIVKDVTQRRLADEALRESEERFRQLAEQSTDGFWFASLNPMRFLYFSKAVEEIWGMPAEKFYANPNAWFSATHPEDQERVRKAWEAASEGYTSKYDAEYRIIRPDGGIRWVMATGTPITNATGETIRFGGIIKDITERKQTEIQVLRTQRLESIGTLAGGIAHDLNNALTPILMIVDLLRKKNPDSAELLDTVLTSAKRGADMVRQLLTFAKGVDGERLLIQPMHLFKEMEKIIKVTFPKNIELRTNFHKDLRTILGDSTQLHQVLLNLCVNARDAMPNGGILTLEAEDIEIDSTFASTLRDSKPGTFVVCRISDTGAGISPDILDRIFEPFFSTKGPDKGTGLGLSTVVGIVRSHGGFVRVYSVLNQGSSFSVFLPVDDTPSEKNADALEQDDFQGNGELILIVDDEPAVRDILREVLTTLNFQSISASDGTEALIQVAERRGELRAVITDLHMPFMDGLAFVKILKHMLPEVLIIVTSGRLEERDAREFNSLGVNAFLNKPFTRGDLDQTLKRVFKKNANPAPPVLSAHRRAV